MSLTRLPRLAFVLVAAAVLAVGPGCSKDSKKTRALQQARTYVAAGEYDKAELEFKNVLQIEPGNADALAGLGVMFFEQGRVSSVFPLLSRAKDVQPNNLAVRTKLGMFYLAAGKPAEASAEAEFVLRADPKQSDAALLLASAAFKPEDVAKARATLSALSTSGTAPVKTALALLELRENKAPAAAKLVEEAIALAPKFSDVYAVQALLQFAAKNTAQGEAALKQAAEFAPPRSIHPLQYARFKVQTGDLPTSRSVLEGVAKKTPDYLPALLALTQLYSGEGKQAEAEETLAKVLARDAFHPEAILLSAQLKMAKGELAKAIEDLERARNTFPKMPELHFQLGVAYANKGEADRAIESIQQTLAGAPDHTDANLLYAALHLRKGEAGTSVTQLKKLLQKQPQQLRAWLMLADALRTQNDLPQTLLVYDQIDKMVPGNPQTALMRGLVLMQQNKRPDARAAFLDALKRNADFAPAEEQLINVDLAERKFDDARARVDARIKKQPDNAENHLLLARVCAARNDLKGAEAALDEAIRLRPDAPTPYLLLANLYLASNQQDSALVKLEQVIAKDPKNTQALMTAATIHDGRKNGAKAREYYEKIVEANAKFAPALNNLAYLYSANPNDLEKAFELAQKARELRPQDPNIADTLGWILYQRKQYPWAATVLQEAADKLSTNGEVQYHLGMAQYMIGNEAGAAASLQKAVDSKQEFVGLAEARERLALLRIDVAKLPAAERGKLAQSLAARADDPVALFRLGRLHELEKDLPRAAAAYEAGLKISPKSVPITLQLAAVYRARDENTKASDLLKAARKFAPDDPEVANGLGQLAFASGDYAWAYTLAQEALQRRANTPDFLYDHARSAFAVGRLAEAENSWASFLKIESNSARSAEVRRHQELGAIARGEVSRAGAAEKIAAALKSEPESAVTLLSSAVWQLSKNDVSGAQKHLEKAVVTYPTLAPARKHLALIYARDPKNVEKAYELAMKARETMVDDADLRRAIAILLYHKGEYNRALSALREFTSRQTTDAELFYYEGLTLQKQKNTPASLKALQKALELNLKAELAADARKILAEAAKAQ